MTKEYLRKQTKEAYNDLISGYRILLRNHPTPFGTEQLLHNIR